MGINTVDIINIFHCAIFWKVESLWGNWQIYGLHISRIDTDRNEICLTSFVLISSNKFYEICYVVPVMKHGNRLYVHNAYR
jgi:hypothetical protein